MGNENRKRPVFEITRIGAPILRDFLLAVMGLICLGLGIWLSLADRLGAAGMLFTAGLLLSIFSSLSRFEWFKGLGVEAKMKALDSKLTEADELLGHIRNSVGLMADISFQSMARIGFWDAVIPKQEAVALADSFRKQLKDLGESDAEINRRMEPWHEVNIREQLRPLFTAIDHMAHLEEQRLHEELRSIKQPIDPADPDYYRITNSLSENGNFKLRLRERFSTDPRGFARETEALIAQIPHIGEPAKQDLLQSLQPAIEDVRYYLKHMEFRDRQRWISTPYQ